MEPENYSIQPFLHAYEHNCHRLGISPHSLILSAEEDQLDLSDIPLGVRGINAVLSSISESNTLREVNLAGIHFQQPSTRQLISNIFSQSTTLKSVNFSGCKIDEALGIELSESLARTNCPLVYLSFKDNCLTSKCASTLAKAIYPGLKYLESLDLSGNPIRDAGALEIVNALQSNHRMKHLHLQRTGLGVKAGNGIIQLLRVNSTIQRVSVQYNIIGKRLEDEMNRILAERRDSSYVDDNFDHVFAPLLPEQKSNCSETSTISSETSSQDTAVDSDLYRQMLNEEKRSIQNPKVDSDVVHVLVDCKNKLLDCQVASKSDVGISQVIQSLLWCIDATTMNDKLRESCTETNKALVARLKDVTSELDISVNDNNEICNRIVALEQENKHFEQQMKILRRQLSEQTSQKDTFLHKNKELQSELSTLQQRLAARMVKQENIDVLENKLELDNELKKVEMHNKQLLRQLESQITKNNELEQRLNAKQCKASQRLIKSRQESALRELKEQLEAEQHKNKISNERIGRLQSQLTKVCLSIKDTTKKEKEIQAGKDQAVHTLQKVQSELCALRQQCDSLKADVQILEIKNTKVESSYEMEQKKNQEHLMLMEQRENEIVVLQSQEKDLRIQLKKMTERRDMLSETICRIGNECKRLQESNNRMLQVYETTNNEFKILEEKLELAEKHKAEYKQVIGTLRSTIAPPNQEHTQPTGAENGLLSRKMSEEMLLKHIATKYRRSSRSLIYHNLESPVAIAAANVAHLAHARIVELTKALESRETEQLTLKERVEDLEVQLNEKEDIISEFAVAKQTLNEELDKRQNELETYQAEVEELMGMLVEKELLLSGNQQMNIE